MKRGAQPTTAVESRTREAEDESIPTAPASLKRSRGRPRLNKGAGPSPHALVRVVYFWVVQHTSGHYFLQVEFKIHFSK